MNTIAELIGIAVLFAFVGEAVFAGFGFILSLWRPRTYDERRWRIEGRIAGATASVLLWLAGAVPAGPAVICGTVAVTILYAPVPRRFRDAGGRHRGRLVAWALAGVGAVLGTVASVAALRVPLVGACVGGGLIGAEATFILVGSRPGRRLLARIVPPTGQRWLGSRGQLLAWGAAVGVAVALSLLRHHVPLPSTFNAPVTGCILGPVVAILALPKHRATATALLFRLTPPTEEAIIGLGRVTEVAAVIGAGAGAIAMPAPWRWAGAAVIACALVTNGARNRLRPGQVAPAGLTSSAPNPALVWTATRAVGLAIAVCGWMNGFTEPSAGARSVQIEHSMHLSDLVFALAWAGWPVGMWIASTIGGRLLDRIGARNLLLVGTAFYWGAFEFVGRVSTPESLFGVMFLVGVGNGCFDVAFARFGPWYEDQLQRMRGAEAGLANQIQNAFFSNGSVVAALVALGAVHFKVPLSWHLAAVSVLALTAILGWAGWRLPNLKATDANAAPDATPVAPKGFRDRVSFSVASLREAPPELRRAGILVFCGALPVGVGYVWASVLLARVGGTGWLIVAGLLAFTTAENITRVLVGLLSKRYASLRDPVKLTLISGILGLAAIALIAGSGMVYPTIAGFALLAAGTGPLGPLVQSAAARLWPTRKGAAAAFVTRYSYTALVAGPVVIGPLSTALGGESTAVPLRIALGSLGLLFVVVILLRRSVRAARVVDAQESGEGRGGS